MTAADFVPDTAILPELAEAAAGCQGCELFEQATQTVFGQGRKRARAVLVGEQPGDVEDRQGVPFVGPAGRVLDRALADAGIERRELYLTNAVKHFRWTPAPRSKRRIHATPEARHITACRPWLSAELSAIRPDVVVALGAVASKALFGSSFRLTQHRGEPLDWPPERGAYAGDDIPIKAAFATVHPSAILRADEADRDEAYARFVHDLQLVGGKLHS